MPDMSIRDFAARINKTHPTISTAIRKIKQETGTELGHKQGTGKATLLSEQDQRVLAEHFGVTDTDDPIQPAIPQEASEQMVVAQPRQLMTIPEGSKEITRPQNGHGSEMVLHEAEDLDIEVLDGQVFSLGLLDTAAAVSKVQNSIGTSVDHFVGNRSLLSAGMVRQAQEEGRTLAAQAGAIRWSTYIKTSEEIDLEQAKRLGLLPTEQPPSNHPEQSKAS